MNYDAARIAYLAHAWDSMVITRERAAMALDARKVIARKAIYVDIEQATGVPWWFVAVVDMREGGVEHLGTRHLHNGDRLTGYTKNVPAGRPKVGHEPPFTWWESAIDSIRYQGLNKVARWTIERALHYLESYNGFKYANAGRPSPYVFSCCSIYDPPAGPGGKVLVDHGPIENVVDPQYGCAPFLRILAEADGAITFQREADAPTTSTPTKGTTTGGVIVVAGGAAATAAASGLPPVAVGIIIAAAVAAVAAFLYFHNRSQS